MNKGASGSVDSRSREVAHEFDEHVDAFMRAWYAFIKTRIERWARMVSMVGFMSDYRSFSFQLLN